MYRCLNCGEIMENPKEISESVEVGAQFLDYPVGQVCPSCGGDVKYISSWKSAFLDEIDYVLSNNFDDYATDLYLSDEEKDEIAEYMLEDDYQFWEDINSVIRNLINQKLKDKLKYLRDKEKVSSLDKDEKYDLETLILWEKGELL